MEQIEVIMHSIIDAKEERRKRLARLPYEEKVKILLVLQEMTAPILQARGKNVKPWEIT